MKLASIYVLFLAALFSVGCSSDGTPVAPPEVETPATVTTPLIRTIPGSTDPSVFAPIDFDITTDGFIYALSGGRVDRLDTAGNLLGSVPEYHGAGSLDVDARGNLHLLGNGWITTLSPSGQVLSEVRYPLNAWNGQYFAGLSGIAYSDATGSTFTEWAYASVDHPEPESRILEMDADGRVARLWPFNVAGFDLDGTGHVLALNLGHGALEIFSLRGTLIGSYPVPAEFNEGGTTVLATPDEAVLAGRAGVLRLDLRDGTVSRSNLDPDGLPYLISPRSVLRMPDGGILVRDAVGAGRVVRFSSGGTYLGTWGPKAPPDALRWPYSIRAIQDGSVLIFDESLARFIHLSGGGDILDSWGEAGYRLNQFWFFPSFAVGPDRSAWVMERAPVWPDPSRVRRFRMDGTLLAHWDTAFDAFAIEVDADGHVWVATPGALLVYDARGQLLRTLTGFYRSPFHRLSSFGMDINGRLAIFDTGENRLIMADPDGAILREWIFPEGSARPDSRLRMDPLGRIYAFSHKDRSPVFSGEAATVTWQVPRYTTDFDVDPTGRIWSCVATGRSREIQIYEPIPPDSRSAP